MEKERLFRSNNRVYQINYDEMKAPTDGLLPYGSRAQAWFLIALGSICFAMFVYAAIVSKFFSVPENNVMRAVRVDSYYTFLVPLTLPIIVVAVYFHWFSMKFFKHA